MVNDFPDDYNPELNEQQEREQPEDTNITDIVRHWSEAFNELTQQRHEAGASEYGVLTFLGNDVVRMMAEELADTANYCRMQFIKLMMLQTVLEKDLAEKLGEGTTGVYDGEISIGIQSFKGTNPTGWGR